MERVEVLLDPGKRNPSALCQEVVKLMFGKRAKYEPEFVLGYGHSNIPVLDYDLMLQAISGHHDEKLSCRDLHKSVSGRIDMLLNSSIQPLALR